MSVRFLTALVLSLIIGDPASADPPKKPDPTAELLAKLAKPFDDEKTAEMSLPAYAELIQKKYGVPVIINEKAFQPGSDTNARDARVTPVVRSGLSLSASLRTTLNALDAVYLVRRSHIEIVPIHIAAEETKNIGQNIQPNRMREPLVSAIYKEKALNEALADLAEEYDLNIVVAPQSGDARTGFVSVRMLNLPADKAIELLAIQADLRVIRKGTAYLVTSRDHANELIDESLERKRQKIDLERLRNIPPFFQQPMPPAAPEPKPEK
jgi:hypothetical protein